MRFKIVFFVAAATIYGSSCENSTLVEPAEQENDSTTKGENSDPGGAQDLNDSVSENDDSDPDTQELGDGHELGRQSETFFVMIDSSDNRVVMSRNLELDEDEAEDEESELGSKQYYFPFPQTLLRHIPQSSLGYRRPPFESKDYRSRQDNGYSPVRRSSPGQKHGFTGQGKQNMHVLPFRGKTSYGFNGGRSSNHRGKEGSRPQMSYYPDEEEKHTQNSLHNAVSGKQNNRQKSDSKTQKNGKNPEFSHEELYKEMYADTHDFFDMFDD